jgi:hypothetical protein
MKMAVSRGAPSGGRNERHVNSVVFVFGKRAERDFRTRNTIRFGAAIQESAQALLNPNLELFRKGHIDQLSMAQLGITANFVREFFELREGHQLSSDAHMPSPEL